MDHRPTLIPRFLLAAAIAAVAVLIGACGGPSATSRDTDGPRAGPLIAVTPSATASPSAVAPSTTRTRSPVASHGPADGPFLPQGWRRCVNNVEGFSVGYPSGWHTTEVRPREACRQFHPNVFEIPRESEYPLTALNVGRVEAMPGRADTIHERVLLWRETTVSGHRAVLAETESTGAGLYPVGTRWYGYTFRLGDHLVRVFAAAEPGAAGYADWKAVVDQAARTLHRG
jgi:hypothetical protein